MITTLNDSKQRELLETIRKWILGITPASIKKMMANDALLMVLKLQYVTKTMVGIRLENDVLVALEERCQKLSFEDNAQYWLRDSVENIRKNSVVSVEKFGKRMEVQWGHIRPFWELKRGFDAIVSRGDKVTGITAALEFYDKPLDLFVMRQVLTRRKVKIIDLEFSDKAAKMIEFYDEFFVEDTSSISHTVHTLSSARMWQWLDTVSKCSPADGLLKKIVYLHGDHRIETELTDQDSYRFYEYLPHFTLVVPNKDHIPYLDPKEK